jgi:acyl-CoA synthetase (AMP-forming)/AMP-acid ligase II
MSTSFNLGTELERVAAAHPEKPAVILAGKASQRGPAERITFGALSADVDRYALGLRRAGVRPHMRVLFLVTPGIELVTLLFAVKKLGAVPVMLDAGMGVRRLLTCIEQSESDVLIGVPRAHLLRLAFSGAFRTVRKRFVVGARSIGGAMPTQALLGEPGRAFEGYASRADDLGAVFFTSGSTGVPKGVEWLRRHFAAQMATWDRAFGLRPDDIDLVTFPLFLLFSIAAGRTCVLPAMDFTRPGEVDPANIVSAIREHAPTFGFGSPALWDRVTSHAHAHGLTFPSLRALASGGAPVPVSVLRGLVAMAPNAVVRTPFGATEALPITDITAQEIFEETAAGAAEGRGTCVGAAVHGVTLRVIAITDRHIATWSDALSLPTGAMGEIVVKGDVVTERYHLRHDQTRGAKIFETDPVAGARSVWHRTGDVGYIDARGRVWMGGRMAHIVHTQRSVLYPVCVEGIFDTLPFIKRSALVGIPGTRDAALVYEACRDVNVDVNAITRLAEKHAVDVRYLIEHQKGLPVDRRHNAKIDRPSLGVWAKGEVKKGRARDVQPWAAARVGRAS